MDDEPLGGFEEPEHVEGFYENGEAVNVERGLLEADDEFLLQKISLLVIEVVDGGANIVLLADLAAVRGLVHFLIEFADFHDKIGVLEEEIVVSGWGVLAKGMEEAPELFHVAFKSLDELEVLDDDIDLEEVGGVLGRWSARGCLW